MTGLLKDLVGRQVVVYSGESGGYRDHGVLEAFDEHWFRLREKNGDLLYFSVHMTRLIKLEERT